MSCTFNVVNAWGLFVSWIFWILLNFYRGVGGVHIGLESDRLWCLPGRHDTAVGKVKDFNAQWWWRPGHGWQSRPHSDIRVSNVYWFVYSLRTKCSLCACAYVCVCMCACAYRNRVFDENTLVIVILTARGVKKQVKKPFEKIKNHNFPKRSAAVFGLYSILANTRGLLRILR